MRLQRFVWFVDRIMIYVVLFVLSVVILVSLTYEIWMLSLIAGILFLFALYKGLIRVRLLRNSVVVRLGKVLFFVPETTVRDRFDFVTRGQKIIQLPEYQILDRPFKIEFFFSGREGTVCTCRLSLRFAYRIEPTAWQHAYDSFVQHGEQLPITVKKLLLKSCNQLKLQPVAMTGEGAIQEYLTPIVAQLNQGVESVGLEVVEVNCSFSDAVTLVRFLAGDQQELEEGGQPGTTFKWRIREEEEAQGASGVLLEINGNVVR